MIETERRARAPRLLPVAILALATAIPAAGADAAGAEDAADHARRVESALASTRGLVAAFTQTLESPGLPGPRTERGTVYLLRPGRMRWEYEEPEGKLAVADGERAYLYLPEDRQAVVSPLDLERAGQGMALLLQERIDLRSEFTVAWGPPPGDGGIRPLLLTPRTEHAEYEHLLVVAGRDGLIRGLTIVDALGGRVIYRFRRIRRVETLPDSLFRFVVPPGIDLQEVRP